MNVASVGYCVAVAIMSGSKRRTPCAVAAKTNELVVPQRLVLEVCLVIPIDPRESNVNPLSTPDFFESETSPI